MATIHPSGQKENRSTTKAVEKASKMVARRAGNKARKVENLARRAKNLVKENPGKASRAKEKTAQKVVENGHLHGQEWTNKEKNIARTSTFEEVATTTNASVPTNAQSRTMP